MAVVMAVEDTMAPRQKRRVVLSYEEVSFRVELSVSVRVADDVDIGLCFPHTVLQVIVTTMRLMRMVRVLFRQASYSVFDI